MQTDSIIAGVAMLKRVLGLIVVVIAFICLYAAFTPPGYVLSREMLVKATPEAIFPYINNSKKAQDWMPWKDSDPAAQMQYSGPDEGVGSTSSWDSTGPLGTGKAEVVESVQNKVVKTQLTYTRPMTMSQLAEIALTPTLDGTVVRWSVSGQSPFLCRVVGIFMNMDKMIGGEFEKGLKKLKLTLESAAQQS